MLKAVSLALASSLTVAQAAPSQTQAPAPPSSQAAAPQPEDPIQALVGRLDLERYKATIKGLTQFGDRRQGTDRNRAAVDWIEAQLKSYGCQTERIKYEYVTPQRGNTAGGQRGGRGAGGGRGANQGNKRPGQGGSTIFGTSGRTGVNNDPNLQPDEKLRALNTQPATDGPREEVYCTKVGSKTPGEMYIIGAHMDGYGWGEAANDDGSGTALVMELARIFSSPTCRPTAPSASRCGTTRRPA